MSHSNPADPHPNSFFAAQKQAGPQRRDHRSPIYQQAQSKANAEKNATSMELSMVNSTPKYPLNGLTLMTLGQYMDHTLAFRIISGDFAHQFRPGRQENNMVVDVHLNGKFKSNDTWFDIATQIEPAGRISHKSDAKGVARGSGLALEIGGTGTAENTGPETIHTGDFVMMQPQRVGNEDWEGDVGQTIQVSEMLNRKSSYAKGAIRISTDRYSPDMCAESYWHHIRSFCRSNNRTANGNTCAEKLRLGHDLFHNAANKNVTINTNQDYINNMSCELLRSYLQFAFKFMHHLNLRARPANGDPEQAKWQVLNAIDWTNPAQVREFAQNLGIIPGGMLGNTRNVSKEGLNQFYLDLMHRPEDAFSKPLFYTAPQGQGPNENIDYINKHTMHFHHNGLKVLMAAHHEFRRRIFCKATSPAAPGQDFDYMMLTTV